MSQARTAETNADAQKRWQGRDPVFFHRDQMAVGTELICYGRIDHGAIFKVVEIKTWYQTKTGNTRQGRANTCRHLSDEIVLRNEATGERRQAAFSYFCYSAIWRLADAAEHD